MEDNRVMRVRHACRLGASKLMAHNRTKAPLKKQNDILKEVSYQEAYDKAAEILLHAMHPLLSGWASTLREAHKKGILLVEEVGGVLDSTATVCHGPSIIGIEERGLPGVTLGRVKNRADLIVFLDLQSSRGSSAAYFEIFIECLWKVYTGRTSLQESSCCRCARD